MRILYSGRDFGFVAPHGADLVKLPIGRMVREPEPMVPDLRGAFRRGQVLWTAANPDFGTVDLVITEAFGAAYLYNRLRRGMKMVYERGLISQLVRIARKKHARLAVLDYSDELTIHPVNWQLLEACDLYFKRELALDRWRSLETFHGGLLRIPSIGYRTLHPDHVTKLAPISLGLGERETEALALSETLGEPRDDQKTYDIVYAGNDISRPLRQSIRDELRGSQESRLSIKIPEHPIPFTDFARLIHSTWLCISPPGLGWDCYRHYEAALFGAVPVLSRADITLYEPYVHGEDAIYYDPERPLLEQLKPWLSDKVRLIQMARLAKARVIAHHTRAAKCQSILDSIRSLEPASPVRG